MRIGVIDITGADLNLYRVLSEHFHNVAQTININSAIPQDIDLVIIPPSHLYCSNDALKRRIEVSQLSHHLRKYANAGGFVVGIQSGFDILCKAGLLPGRFSGESTQLVNQCVHITVEFKRSPLTYLMNFDKPIRLYLSHSLGSYSLTPLEISTLKAKGQILLRYCNQNGQASADANPDKSSDAIAAVCNVSKNVFGITANPSINKIFQNNLDGIELMDSFFKMITR